jgi:hypothetical protein
VLEGLIKLGIYGVLITWFSFAFRSEMEEELADYEEGKQVLIKPILAVMTN